jgi:hypothetical protein
MLLIRLTYPNRRSAARGPLPNAAHPARNDALVLLALVLAAGAGSSLLGQDANWDMQNYHYYNPWAWWNGRLFDWDIAAAQVQTYHNPLADLPFFAMVSALWPPRVIAFALSIPTALAGFFVYKLAGNVFCAWPPTERRVAVACAVVLGTTSAMGLGALANTMNEWPLAALVVFALWWLVRAQDSNGAIARPALVVAGLAVGVATAAKLTAAPFAVALGIAVLVRGRGLRAGDAAWFALGATCGFGLAYGPWGYTLWTHFRNPVFPYANQWFASPWWEAAPVPGRTFGPRSVAQFVVFPFALGEPPLFLVAETAYRDGRLPLVWALALVAALAWAWRRMRTGGPPATANHALRVVGSFCAAAFVLWTLAFSIYRYLLPLDALAGVLIAALVMALVPRRIAAGTLVACTIVLVVTTRMADWGRVPFGDRWFEVRAMPIVEPDGLVLITTGEAVSYYIPMLPPSSRYVGALNTLVKPYQASLLAQEVDRVIRNHKGEFYQLTYPLTEGWETVEMHGLRRTSACAVIPTNMPTSPLEFCRLVRKDDESR